MNILGFDPGMGAIKLYADQGSVELPSQLASNGTRELVYATGLSRRHAPPKVSSTAGEFYVGLGAHDWGRPIENMDYDRLGGPEMQVLLYGALSQYERLPEVFDTVAVGLPIETLSGDDAREHAAAVRNWLKGTHTWTTDGRTYRCTIENILLTPQPVGALFDYVLDDSGKPIPERKSALTRETGIISIGFNTIELLVIRDKAPVDRFTTGKTSGVRRLLELIDHQHLYSLGELDAQLRTGQLNYKDALPVWAREVSGAIERHWGQSYRRFERVIVVGGGAILLQNTLESRFGGKFWMPPEPVPAIARGLYKMALYRSRRRR